MHTFPSALRPPFALTVGRKLALAGLLPILLLGLMIANVWRGLDLIRHENARERMAGTAEMHLSRTNTFIQAARVQLRDVISAQNLALLETARSQGAQEIERARDEAVAAQAASAAAAQAASGTAAAQGGGAGAVHGKLTEALRLFDDYNGMRDNVIALRRRMLETRDRLGQEGREYDRMFELVMGGIGFAQPSPEQEESRQRMLALHRAVTEMRLGLQDFMLTDDAGQQRRVRTALQQVRVYLFGLEPDGALAAERRPWAAQAGRIAQDVAGVMTMLDDIARLRREAVVPNRERIETILREAGALLEAEAEAGRQRMTAAMDEARRSMLALGLAMALLLLGLGLLNARSISRPLRQVAGAVAELAAGRVPGHVPGLGRRDEIGIIAQALQALRATVSRAFAQSQMLEQLPLGVMTADPYNEFRITYLNEASRQGLRPLEHLMPCPVDALPGQSLDLFHPPAQRQRIRDLLADPARLPYASQIRLGDEVLALRVTAIRDAAGGYVGPMLTWSLVTAQARLAAAFEAEVGGVVDAVARSAATLQESARGMRDSASRSGAEAGAVAEKACAPGPACRRWRPAPSSSPPAWPR